MTNKINKKLLIGIGIFIIVGYVLTAILRVLTPPAPTIPTTDLVVTNMFDQATEFENIRFIGDGPSLPETLELKQATTQNIAENLKSDLQEKFSLTPQPNTNIAAGEIYTLSTSQPEAWVLSKKTTTIVPILIQTERALETATTFVQTQLEGFTNTPYLNGVEYFEADNIHFDVSEPAEANLVSIPFAPNINGFPVFLTNENTYPLVVNVSSSYQVEKVTFNPTIIQIGATVAELEPITVSEAVSNINKNKGAIIQSTQTEFGEMKINQITSGELDFVVLEYRVDNELGVAYPFYRFSGTAINAQGIKLDVEIITPAVATR